MRYAVILAYIDAEIDRLQRARDLLAGSPVAEKTPSKRITRVRRKAIKPETTSIPKQSTEVQPIQRLPYKNKAKSRRTVSVPKSHASSNALSSQVPVGPVVVSADVAKKARDRVEEQIPRIPPTPAGEARDTGRSLDSLIRAFTAAQRPGGIEVL
jgi:hypothetical protein